MKITAQINLPSERKRKPVKRFRMPVLIVFLAWLVAIVAITVFVGLIFAGLV